MNIGVADAASSRYRGTISKDKDGFPYYSVSKQVNCREYIFVINQGGTADYFVPDSSKELSGLF